MRIIRFPHLTEPQFFGCTAAFVDSLAGELNLSTLALRRLQGHSKGAAFAYEMALDTHRYGTLIVLDRWSTLVRAFGRQMNLSIHRGIVDDALARVQSAENILGRMNELIDAAPTYAGELVEACVFAFQSLNTTFSEERDVTEQNTRLGPMLPEDYTEARRIFLEDLAAR